jgi:hypothetical protein
VAPLNADQGSDNKGDDETNAEVNVHSQGDLLMIVLCQYQGIHTTTSLYSFMAAATGRGSEEGS